MIILRLNVANSTIQLTNNTREKIIDLTINKMFKRVLLNEHVPKTCSAKHVPPNKKCGCLFGNNCNT